MAVMTRAQVGRRWVALSLCALALCGCTAQPDQQSFPAWSAQFAEAKQKASTQFEKDVLQDDVVTRAEYEEAIQRYISCIEDNGAEVSVLDQAGYYIYAAGRDSELYDQASAICTPGTIGSIEPLYVGTLTNPGNKDPDEMVAECFVAMELVDAPFGKAEFTDLIARSGAVTSVDGVKLPSPPIDPAAVAVMEHEDAMNCMANPSYHEMPGNGE